MKLIIARHGNTFEAGESPVMVGAKEDLALTAAGQEQAKAVGEALKNVPIRRAFTSQLKRTKVFAQIALAWRNIPAKVDERLSEIDYGPWGGLSEEQVAAAGGQAELEAWNKQSVWPPSPGWSPSLQALERNVEDFATELAKEYPNDTIFAVSSNGVMRFFLKLIDGAFEQAVADGTFKVKTGNLCALEYQNGKWQVLFWNKKPIEIDVASLQ